MRMPRPFHLPLVGGPLDGQRRRVPRAPQELPASIALPCRENRRRNPSADASEDLAVYQLKNENGQWRYYHLRTATSEELGVDESRPNEEPWSESCPV